MWVQSAAVCENRPRRARHHQCYATGIRDPTHAHASLATGAALALGSVIFVTWHMESVCAPCFLLTRAVSTVHRL